MAAGVKAPAVPAVRRRVRGGIPVYVADVPAPARCALMFRVGRADETLLTGGVTHLVEHLALFSLGDKPYQYNGFVEPHRTVFHAAGTPEECVGFLAEVTASLADLPMHRLEHEHRVLGAEAAGRGSGVVDALVTYRFGPAGLGLVAYPQFCVQSMDARKVDAWRAANFTAGNAAVVVSGIAVEDLELALPAGARRPLTAASAIEADLPAWFPAQGGGLGVSMVAARGAGLSAGLRILEKRLQKRLRTEMAIVYHAAVSSQHLDAGSMHVVVACDPVPDHAADARTALGDELARLADEGPSEDEMEAERRALLREWDDPLTGYALADFLAVDELLGAGRRTPAAIAKAARTVTAAEVAGAVAAAARTALWAVPGHIEGPAGMAVVSMSSKRRVEGRRLAPVAPAANGHQPEERLVVGAGGVGIDGPDWYVHVDFEHCAGALAWRDGMRVLYGEDGFVLRLRPWEWAEGARAVAEVDAKLGPARVIDMGDGDGPPPPAPPPAVPATGARRRVHRILAGLFLGMVGLLAVSCRSPPPPCGPPRSTAVLTRPINWYLIAQQYDQLVKYATALRLGTAEAEQVLRRFTRGGPKHPTYQALENWAGRPR